LALKNHSLGDVPRGTPGLLPLSAYDEKALLQLRAQIDAQLGIGNLADLDIGQEIVLQLRTLKILQHEALRDDEAPHGQKAQASTTVSRMLTELAKSRHMLYSAERIKQIELMTIDAMKDAPDEAKEAFFERLERYLATMPTLDSLMAEAAET
jgi:hypothetical protein